MGLFDKLQGPVFLKEESDTKEYIQRLEGLQEKAEGSIKEKIDREIKLASIGELGENNVAFELKNSGIPMYIMRDVHLEVNGLSAQIDFLVVTRKIIFVIECKNLIGDIDIDAQGNFIRKYNLFGKHIKEGVYSPITQSQRHLEVLKQARREKKRNILTKYMFEKYFDENYKSIVVLANPKTVLDARYAKKEIKQKIIRADQLIQHIKDIYNSSTVAAFNDKDMLAAAERHLEMHTPNKKDYGKKYEEILQNISNEKENQDTEAVIKPVQNNKNEEELIDKLKAFRLEKSRQEQLKPYYIFNDKQMMDLIQKMPSSKEELLEVSGFGPVKVNKYGMEILDILVHN